MVDMTKVDRSSAVAEVGHDADANVLHVKFRSGDTVYTYPNVTAEHHAQLMAAPSMMQHIAEVIGPRSRGS